jgi:hypothetical protein
LKLTRTPERTLAEVLFPKTDFVYIKSSKLGYIRMTRIAGFGFDTYALRTGVLCERSLHLKLNAETGSESDRHCAYISGRDDLSQWLGRKPVALFFTSGKWCPQCNRAIPAASKIRTVLQRQSVDFVTIWCLAAGSTVADAENAVFETMPDWTVLIDSAYATAGELRVTGVPTVLFFNSRGEEVARESCPRKLNQSWLDALNRVIYEMKLE